MMRRMFIAACGCWAGFAAAAPTVEITLVHDLDSRRAAVLAVLAEQFNRRAGTGHVVVRKDSGERPARGAPPHLVLLRDDDDVGLIGARRIDPLQRFMGANGRRFDARRIFPALREAADDGSGRLRALPLAYFLPVLYFNRDTLERAGAQPPGAQTTWLALQELAGTLHDGGNTCPYTSSWPVWVHLENNSAQNREPFFATGAGALRLAFNGLGNVKHVAVLSSWARSGYFRHFGDADQADERFVSGQCALLTSGSDAYPRFRNEAPFAFGVAQLPYHDDVYGATPASAVPGGGSLWVLAGHKRAQDRVTASFIAFLLEPEIQKRWVADTGFLPMSDAAGLSEVAGLGKPPAALLAFRLGERNRLAGARLRDATAYRAMRAIVGEELSAVWDGKPAKAALDAAVLRGNAALQGGARR